MGIPLHQAARIGTYLLRQHLSGRERYPLVLMLEPLFRCNLACAGCGKIDYPAEILEPAAVVRRLHGRDRRMRRARRVDRRRRAAVASRDAEDREGLPGAQEVRDPVHQRAAAGQEDRRLPAASLFHLVDPPRRQSRDARQVGVPAGHVRQGGRSHQARQVEGLPRQHQLHAVQRRQCRRAWQPSSTT